ncbi:hypothetical protein qu_24 [Acanthamoeba polyphaga mimivirus]|nr:hypothetical protein [Mimivirus reunion]WMV61362.1 hypothetical protein qu_24 [Mimivirus sp.]WMV62339.1 hypothetical protein qu_24 [Acanthamoeba polyphaga mimivirus]WMV63316.1 hypothetical protein qu_24 [Mimivirus sp.]
MAKFIDERTFCYKCGMKVLPGIFHRCEKTTPFEPVVSDTYWCAHCQSTIRIIFDGRIRRCSNCGHDLHGGIANKIETVVHRDIESDKMLRRFMDPYSYSSVNKTNDRW